ncbi:MAG: hypothetical protein AAF639_29435 [Chloroflexota bacterium]
MNSTALIKTIMTNNLYDILKEMGTDPTPESFADALWLSKHVPATEPNSVSALNMPDLLCNSSEKFQDSGYSNQSKTENQRINLYTDTGNTVSSWT